MGDDPGSDSEHGDAELKETKSVHLGDCGCITTEDQDRNLDEDGDLSSESSENKDEEDITIELDLAQEIYIDKSQEGVPYKKGESILKMILRILEWSII